MANPLVTRREALQLSAGALLALGLWPGCATQGAPSGSFRFLVVNDTHYLSPECGVWLEGAVRQMKMANAEFCLLAGDLSDHGRKEELGAVREIFSQLAIPTHVQIGNHDYFSQTDRAAYEQLFPGRINYHFDHRGWQFVSLDTTEGLLFEKTTIQDPTFRWLDENLPHLDQSKPTVILTHFPLGAEVRYRPQNADALLERFLPYNLRAVFSGHFHSFTERQRGATSLTTNRCCSFKRSNHDGTPEKGYFLCEASEGKISRTFVEYKPS